MSSQQKNGAGQVEVQAETRENIPSLLQNLSSLTGAAEMSSIFEASIDMVQKLMNAEAASLMLFDESSGELILSMPTGPVRHEVKGKRIPEGKGIAGWVFENQETYFTNNPEEDEHFVGEISGDFVTRNIICSPIFDDSEQPIGVLQAMNRPADSGFGEKDYNLFEALAEHIGIAVDRMKKLKSTENRLKEKEMMLTEVHHRIKNNLSMITALIEMEVAELEDEYAKDVLRKTCSRIQSMTEVHDLLYNAGIDNRIDLAAYLKKIASKIGQTFADPAQQIEIEIRSKPLKIDIERAITCGLILSELIVNCYKHAFTDKEQKGVIAIKVNESKDHYITLKVSDNGQGIGDNFRFDTSESVGGWLVKALLKRLEAALDISQDNGTSFMIRFKR